MSVAGFYLLFHPHPGLFHNCNFHMESRKALHDCDIANTVLDNSRNQTNLDHRGWGYPLWHDVLINGSKVNWIKYSKTRQHPNHFPKVIPVYSFVLNQSMWDISPGENLKICRGFHNSSSPSSKHRSPKILPMPLSILTQKILKCCGFNDKAVYIRTGCAALKHTSTDLANTIFSLTQKILDFKCCGFYGQTVLMRESCAASARITIFHLL